MGKLLMKKLNKSLVCIFVLLAFSSCIFKASKEQEYEESRFLFGTYVKIKVYAEDKTKATNAMNDAFDEISRLDEKFNSKMENSIISNLAKLDKKEIELDEEGIELINIVKDVYELSNHAYDVTIAPLMRAWGFEEGEEDKIPSEEELKEALRKVDFSKVKLEGNKLTMEEPLEMIDTGSFLKGYALLQAKEKIKEHGIKRAFLTCISSVETIGTKPEGKPWRIGIQNPEEPSAILGVLEVKDASLAISGDYQTYVTVNGEKYHHIIDKKTGYPVTDKKLVVLMSKDDKYIDALSTAFFLMPIEEVVSYVESQENLEVLIIDDKMNKIKTKGFNLK